MFFIIKIMANNNNNNYLLLVVALVVIIIRKRKKKKKKVDEEEEERLWHYRRWKWNLLPSATVLCATAFGFEYLDVKHFSPYHQRDRICSVDGSWLDKEVCGRSFKRHRRQCSTLLRQRWGQKVK